MTAPAELSRRRAAAWAAGAERAAVLCAAVIPPSTIDVFHNGRYIKWCLRYQRPFPERCTCP